MGDLTPHISLAEMTHTSHSELAQENAWQALNFLPSLRRVAQMLEEVRGHFGYPLIIHSGYRCPALNLAVGGVKNSQHMSGQAADFHVDGVALRAVYDWVVLHSGLQYGQCLMEHRPGAPASWVHLSIQAPGSRRLDHHDDVTGPSPSVVSPR